jgi:hypothetical protein
MLFQGPAQVMYYGELPFGTEARVSSPLVIHIVRPYDSEDRYLEAESWSIEAKTMLLIGQRKLAADTAILFVVALSSGQKVIKAEARVIGWVPAKGGRPGGLRVHFKRFGTATKAFIDRAVSINEQARSEGEEPPPSEPQAAEAAPAPPTPAERTSVPAVGADRPSAPEPVAEAPIAQEAAPVNSPPDALAPVVPRAEPSGIHRRVVAPVPAPPNREELLEKLRARSRSLAKTRDAAAVSEDTG